MRKTLLAVVALISLNGCSRHDGSRVGVITKVSKHSGWWLTSYEGDLKVGASSVMNPEHWAFSMKDDAIYKGAEEASRKGLSVELMYFEPNGPVYYQDTGFTVTGIRFLDKDGNIVKEIK